jgi:hypothetical protein
MRASESPSTVGGLGHSPLSPGYRPIAVEESSSGPIMAEGGQPVYPPSNCTDGDGEPQLQP